MQSDNRFFDDLVKLVNGAAGTFAGMGREAEAGARTKAKEWLGGLDFVGRDEFEAVKAMAAAARDEADALRRRIGALEGKGAPVPTEGAGFTPTSTTDAAAAMPAAADGPHVRADAADAAKAEAASYGVDTPE